MDESTLVDQAKRIKASCANRDNAMSALIQARELMRTYAGEKSAFYRSLLAVDQDTYHETIVSDVRGILDAFIGHVENGLMQGMSVERQARIDVVSDILEQSQTLLDTRGVHPAAPAMLIGAALEEFLRNWVEDCGLSLGNRKPSLDAYCGLLRGQDLISKQDSKDITAWAGVRNHAAHGEWSEVGDMQRIRLMLEGVNLFMRRYESHARPT